MVTNRIQISFRQVKLKICVRSRVRQYGWPLWDSKELRSAMCPLLILPKWLHLFPAQNKIALPHRLDRLILYRSHEDLRSNPSDSAPRTVTRMDNFPLLPYCSLSLLFLLPLKDSCTSKLYLHSVWPPPSFGLHLPPMPLFPSDRLSDSKSETLIQRSAQVSWILLKSHFHFTSSLLASLPPTRKHLPLPLLSLSPSWPHPYTSPISPNCWILILSECRCFPPTFCYRLVIFVEKKYLERPETFP